MKTIKHIGEGKRR